MTFKGILGAIIRYLEKLFIPTSLAAGLQITDSSIRYIELRPNSDTLGEPVIDKSLRLPPGLIEQGRIKDRSAFLSALIFLKHKIALGSKRKLSVVLTIPAGDVYAQAFSVPNLSGTALEEAVKLNLEVISPNPIAKTYYSWKIVGEGSESGNQIEILGVFALREAIDDLSSAIEEAGFGIVAIEFSSLSLVRILNSFKLIEKGTSYLLIKLTQDGLIFMIIKNGGVYFNYFHSWDKVAYEGNNVSVKAVSDIIKSESQRILNFYYSHFGGQINNIVLITAVLSDQLAQFIKSEYPNFKFDVVNSAKDNFHGARGAALRGLIPRIHDDDINLMGSKVINTFWLDQIISFIGLWRNTVLTVVGFVLIIFIAANLFLAKEHKRLEEAVAINSEHSGAAEFAAIEAKISEFNKLVAAGLSANDLTDDVAPFIKKLNSTANNSGVFIHRFGFRTGALDIDLLGVADTKDKIIDFKNDLTALTGVYEVNLPLSGILTDPRSGGFSFTMTFKINSLKDFQNP